MAIQVNVSKALLRNVPLFAMLPEDLIAVLTTVVGRKSVARGAIIIAAGDLPDSLYVVISGRIKVIMRDDKGREVILSILGRNEYFGEMGLIDDSPRSASVIALQACELLAFSKHDFWKCVSDNFDMAMMVMCSLVQRLRDADRKIRSLALMDVYGRVAGMLLEMSETIDGQHVVKQKVTKKDMAKRIGASREMVTRVMKDLQARGFIEIRGKSIYLRDNIATIS